MENKGKKQYYCLEPKCGFTCNKQSHGIFSFITIIACLPVALSMGAMKYLKSKERP